VPGNVNQYLWDQPWNSNGTINQQVPRLRYNEENMRLEIFDTVSKLWKVWRIK